MTCGTGTIRAVALCILTAKRMHTQRAVGLLGAGTATANAPRAGAMFSGDDLNRKGYPKIPGHPEWLRAAYERGVP